MNTRDTRAVNLNYRSAAILVEAMNSHRRVLVAEIEKSKSVGATTASEELATMNKLQHRLENLIDKHGLHGW